MAAGALSTLVAASPPENAQPVPASDQILPIADQKGPQPVAIVRRLLLLQQQIVLGDGNARSRQLAAVHDAAQELAVTPVEAWSAYRNREALVTFVLIGGQPDLLEKVVESGQFPAAELPLAHGAVAYGGGDKQSAHAQLGETEPRDMSPTLAGRVALTRAVLALTEAPEEASVRLDEARVLSPGTMVEETALRLTMDFAQHKGDPHMAYTALIRYVHRFPKAPFFDGIVTRTVQYLGSSSLAGGQDAPRKFQLLTIMLPPERRAALSVQLAEAALTSGNLTLSIAAAQEAGSASDVALRAAGHIIEGSARMLGDDREESIKLLDAAEKEQPAPRYWRLAAAARSLRASIDRPLRLATGQDSGGEWKLQTGAQAATAPLPPLFSGAFDKAIAAIGRAQAKLAESDALLGQEVE